MKINMGTLDRILRTTIAVLLGVLYYMGTLSGIVGIIALVVVAVLLLTSLFSFCPIYAIVGLSTCSNKEHNKAEGDK